MRAHPVLAAAALAAATLAAGAAAPPAERVPEAEAQYRLAQRLAAERSADAPDAFRKAVELAPHGPLADDALVDLARALGAPSWPEELGRLDSAAAARIIEALGAVVESHADGDRAREARYRLALVRIAPIPGRDPARARRELIDLAQAAPADGVALSARYALGVLDEQAGNIERAAGAYARIVVERPDAEAASRARCGFARFLLSRGEFGPAAGWFQEALDGGAPEALAPGAQRDLALRAALRRDTPALRWSALTSKPAAVPTSKGAALLASDGQGGIVVFDHKSDEVQAFDAKGRPRAPMALPDVSALASDPYGRVFAATKDKIVRLDGGTPVPVLDLGSFASPSAIAADAAGSIWIADRKGDRVGRWVPGAGAPVVVRDAKGAGVRALAVRGQDVIAAEEKTGALILISGAGGETAFGSAPFRRPVALSVDAAGRVAVLDEKAGTLTRLTAAGAVEDTLSLSPQGIEKPLSIASARNGAVRVLDAASGSVFEAP